MSEEKLSGLIFERRTATVQECLDRWVPRAGSRLVYAAEPGERVKLLPDGSAIVAHPERAPFLIDRHGQRSQLTCPHTTEHQGKIYVAHKQTLYRLDETELTPIEFTTDAD